MPMMKMHDSPITNSACSFFKSNRRFVKNGNNDTICQKFVMQRSVSSMHLRCMCLQERSDMTSVRAADVSSERSSSLLKNYSYYAWEVK